MDTRQALLEIIGGSGMSDRQVSVLATGGTDTVRNIRRGVSPRIDTLERLCDVLGLRLQITSPRSSASSPDLDSDPLEGAAEDPAPYGAALPPAQPSDIGSVARALARLASEAGADPIPPDLREVFLREEVARIRLEYGAYDFVKRYDVRLAAGAGEAADQEAVTGYVAFRRDWLLEHKLRPQNLSLVEVTGRSMEPTLSNGDSVLVDHSRRELYNSKLYALNVDGSLIVKRVRRVRGGWAAESDSPLHESFDLKQPYAVIGRVVWRAHTEWRRGGELKRSANSP